MQSRGVEMGLAGVHPDKALEEIEDVEGLERIWGEWHELWRRCPSATPFQAPGWIIPWWRHLGSGQLWVLALRCEGRLCGVAPFYIVSAGSGVAVDGGRPEPPRQVLLLGTGITDHLDILVEPEHEQVGAEAFLAHVTRHSARWDIADFQQLSPGSALLTCEVHPDWRSEVGVQEVCPALALPESLSGLRRSPAGRMMEKLQYYRRRAAREGGLVVEEADPGNLDELFGCFLKLHQARWLDRRQQGVVHDRVIQEFHREVMAAMLRAGVLRLYALHLNHNWMAVAYGFCSGGRTFYYLGGFDPEYARLSPGTLAIGHAVEQAVKEHCHEFDFLRGRESYKYMWGARARLNCRRRLHPMDSASDYRHARWAESVKGATTH